MKSVILLFCGLTIVCMISVLSGASLSEGIYIVTREKEENFNLPKLRMRSNGTFKLVIFADLHYGEEPSSSWGPLQDINSSIVTSNILDWEQPDFVVFTGDQLTAEFMYPNASEYVRMLVKPLVEKGYRWASTYGNHDIGPNVTRIEILEAEQSFSNLSYTMRMTNDSIPGVTNYYLLLYPHDLEDVLPCMIFWFFDSQGGRNNDGQQPHHIDPFVVQWFKTENDKLKKLWGPLPSLVFFHIPTFMQNCENVVLVVNRIEFVQAQEDISTNPLCSGLVDDDVTPQDNNTGIMGALNDAGGVQAVFVGHDHGNGWCCFHGEIRVCYGRHTGYGGYGSWERGSRVLHLAEEINSSQVRISRNYVRMESGGMIDEFPKL